MNVRCIHGFVAVDPQYSMCESLVQPSLHSVCTGLLTATRPVRPELNFYVFLAPPAQPSASPTARYHSVRDASHCGLTSLLDSKG